MDTPRLTRSIVADLTEHGYSVTDDLLSSTQLDGLRHMALEHHALGRLVPARTGKARDLDRIVRGDSILWLDDESNDERVVELLALLSDLQGSLNQQLFLNLHEIEAHWAIYPPGAGYEKHLDQFADGDQARQLSLVLYLNEDWNDSDGGNLRIHIDGSATAHVDVAPLGGRLVLFNSSEFWHEVLPATRERLSITGWFRTRSPLS